MKKPTLRLVIADGDLVRYDLDAFDQTSLNHPKLSSLPTDISNAIRETFARIRGIGPDEIPKDRFDLSIDEIEKLYLAISKVIFEKITEISSEPKNEEGSPDREMEALRKYRNLIFEWFRKEWGIFEEE
jgi:hypothetical protein